MADFPRATLRGGECAPVGHLFAGVPAGVAYLHNMLSVELPVNNVNQSTDRDLGYIVIGVSCPNFDIISGVFGI